MKRLAPCFVQVIRCGAHILAGAAPGHALKHQALIRPDYPGRRVVRQYLVLETRNFVLNSKQLWLALERVFKLCVGCMFVRMCDRWGLRDVAFSFISTNERKWPSYCFYFFCSFSFLFRVDFFFSFFQKGEHFLQWIGIYLHRLGSSTFDPFLFSFVLGLTPDFESRSRFSLRGSLP